MAYEWRPSAARSVTTDPKVVVPPVLMAAAIAEFIEAAEQGRAVNRSGRDYRPSALRDLSGILRCHVAPELGSLPLREVGRQHIQALVDRLAEERLSQSRIRSVISALRAFYGYAIEQGHAEFNPADGLVMPEGGRATSSEDAIRDEGRREEGRRPTLVDRLDDAWADRPRWEDRPPKPPKPPGPPRPPREPKRRDRDRSAYEPIAVLPERILSIALRAGFLLLVVVILISLLQPA